MGYQMAGYFIFKRKVLRWSKAPQDRRVDHIIQAVSFKMGLSKKVLPFISDAVSGPLVIGFFRPLLILPREDYSDTDLSFIVSHELTHCKRNDLWYKLLLIITNAIHWYNPIIYLMYYEASGDLEVSCDDAITKGISFSGRKAYTEAILASIQQEMGKKTALSTYFHGGKRTMKNRFSNILNTGKKRRGVTAFIAVLLTTILAGGLIACTADTGLNSEDNSDNKYSNSEYEKLLNDPPMTGDLLAEKDGQAYVLYTPLDMGIMDSEKAEEYMQLYLPTDQIIERFYLISDHD